jgi:hypothetical protein
MCPDFPKKVLVLNLYRSWNNKSALIVSVWNLGYLIAVDARFMPATSD